MKATKVLSIITSAILSVSFLNLDIDKYAHTAVAADASTQTYNSWQEAYRAVLDEYMQSDSFDGTDEKYGEKYELYDIDTDGTPELFVSGGEYHFSDLYVYTFVNNMIVCLGDENITGAYGKANVIPTKKYVFFEGGSQGYSWKIVYEKKSDRFEKVATLEDTSAAIQAEYYGYKFNGTKITKAQYDSYVEGYTRSIDYSFSSCIYSND